jgi:hypothetical protein
VLEPLCQPYCEQDFSAASVLGAWIHILGHGQLGTFKCLLRLGIYCLPLNNLRCWLWHLNVLQSFTGLGTYLVVSTNILNKHFSVSVVSLQ